MDEVNVIVVVCVGDTADVEGVIDEESKVEVVDEVIESVCVEETTDI